MWYRRHLSTTFLFVQIAAQKYFEAGSREPANSKSKQRLAKVKVKVNACNYVVLDVVSGSCIFPRKYVRGKRACDLIIIHICELKINHFFFQLTMSLFSPLLFSVASQAKVILMTFCHFCV